MALLPGYGQFDRQRDTVPRGGPAVARRGHSRQAPDWGQRSRRSRFHALRVQSCRQTQCLLGGIIICVWAHVSSHNGYVFGSTTDRVGKKKKRNVGPGSIVTVVRETWGRIIQVGKLDEGFPVKTNKHIMFPPRRHARHSPSSPWPWQMPPHSSPDFGLLPAGQSSAPRWPDKTHLTACTPVAGLCNGDGGFNPHRTGRLSGTARI